MKTSIQCTSTRRVYSRDEQTEKPFRGGERKGKLSSLGSFRVRRTIQSSPYAFFPVLHDEGDEQSEPEENRKSSQMFAHVSVEGKRVKPRRSTLSDEFSLQILFYLGLRFVYAASLMYGNVSQA
jgi:hypothetical protein